MQFKDYLREASKKDILKRFKKLKKMSKSELLNIYSDSDNITDIVNESAADIINIILFDEFREIDIEQAFNEEKIK